MIFIPRIVPALVVLALVLTGCATMELPEKSEDELPSAELFQGADVIVIEMSGDPESVRRTVVQGLRSETFALTTPTLEESTIATEPKVFGSGVQGSARYFVDIPDTEGEPVRLYGSMIEENVEDRNTFQRYTSYRIVPGSQRLSLGWHAWTTMSELANVLADGELTYDRN